MKPLREIWIVTAVLWFMLALIRIPSLGRLPRTRLILATATT